MTSQLVTCETTAGIVLHVRHVADDKPVRLGGHPTPRPLALCNRAVDYDTQQPVAIEHVTCGGCKAALAALIADGAPAALGEPASPGTAAAEMKLCERCGERPAIPRRPGPARCTECVATKAARKSRRRSSLPRGRTIGRSEIAIEVRMYAAIAAAPEGEALPPRPRTRGECQDGPRPCPWVACKQHLYLEVNPENGSIKLHFPNLEPWELKHSCALDVAELGGVTLEEVGEIMNVTRERVRQLEVRGLLKLKMGSPSPDELGADLLAAARAGEVLP